MGLVPSGLKNEMKSKFTELRNELSKSVIVYTEPLKEDCPNCLHDHTGVSLNIFDTNFVTPVIIFGSLISPTSFSRGRCPVCSGNGRLEYESSSVIQAIVRWNPPGVAPVTGDMTATPAGLDGRNVVRIKADRSYYTTIRDATKIVVDGITCYTYLPPVFRSAGEVDIMVTAYFVSAKTDFSVRE